MTQPPALRHAVIVAHGVPSDPEPQEAVLQALAARVGAHLPGWQVRGATLAAEGALAQAVRGLDAPLIYPFFMAEGWFTGTLLPRRLAQAGAEAPRLLPPFGTDPAMPALLARIGAEAAVQAGLIPAATAVLLAAHGSQVSRGSADGAQAMALALARLTPFRAITPAFVEEAPFIADVARDIGPALCLPFFALRAGHVTEDLPQALDAAGFTGPRLPPVGEHPEAPALIAAALRRAAAT